MGKTTIIVFFFIAISMVPAQEAIGPLRPAEVDREHAEWIESVMRSTSTIKPGDARKDLLQVFTEEGGLSTRTHRTYVYKHCPNIKVDVDFVAVGNENDGSTEMPEDKITTISRPYLAYSTMD
jgi:hypothetical protein